MIDTLDRLSQTEPICPIEYREYLLSEMKSRVHGTACTASVFLRRHFQTPPSLHNSIFSTDLSQGQLFILEENFLYPYRP